ncbi:hypothetical protein LBMAG56_28920 [Verrucomicrobiota bacterium]|nr:hypothetical protein LBMAG56_28920 [Verrucomicrobiota bacterium]
MHAAFPRRLAFALALKLTLAAAFVAAVHAEVGDPQIQTDHPWYPGELACSNFERLFATQARQYQRVTGIAPTNDLHKALASWFWRNTHYAHGEEGAENWWDAGFTKGGDTRGREYWTGLFAHGFGLCGTTHSQWSAEMEYLLGHARGRGVGMQGHNAFEVFLTGGDFGAGRWALLDHDLSTVIFDPTGRRLLSAREVKTDWQKLIRRDYEPKKQHGWLVCGLHPGDGGSYRQFNVAEYLPGYAGPPPMIRLRRGEKLRRHFQPGLDDGRTFVFWGRNYRTRETPGPERSITWVNQPEKMFGSRDGAGYQPGLVRYANAAYSYAPDFTNGDYRDGVVSEDAQQVTFEFHTPFIIGTTPANQDDWGIYAPGGRNGLVLHGQSTAAVAVSVDCGRSWFNAGALRDQLDLTDQVKGHRQYHLRIATNAAALAQSGLRITTVCQANAAILPRLKDNGTTVSFAASAHAVVSAGPTRAQAQTHLVAGGFGKPAVTLALRTPRGEPVAAIHAAAHVASSNPPRAEVRYQIEFSTDAGKTWQPIVKDWNIPRRGDEPSDFWSQSLCYGSIEIPAAASSAPNILVRFRNDGGKPYLRAEAHLVYRTTASDTTRVTFDWTDATGPHRAAHEFMASSAEPAAWKIPTAANVQTRWVEFETIPIRRQP